MFPGARRRRPIGATRFESLEDRALLSANGLMGFDPIPITSAPPQVPAPPAGPTYPTVQIDWANLAPNPLNGTIEYNTTGPTPIPAGGGGTGGGGPDIVVVPSMTALPTPASPSSSTVQSDGTPAATNTIPVQGASTTNSTLSSAGAGGTTATPDVLAAPSATTSPQTTASASTSGADTSGSKGVDAFIADTYQTLLSRPVAQSDLAFWGRMARRFGDEFVVDALLHSTEHRARTEG
jgi:hypothetical protein